MLQWNCDSQMLVIMFANQAYACLYEAEQKSLSRIEIGLKVGCHTETCRVYHDAATYIIAQSDRHLHFMPHTRAANHTCTLQAASSGTINCQPVRSRGPKLKQWQLAFAWVITLHRCCSGCLVVPASTA